VNTKRKSVGAIDVAHYSMLYSLMGEIAEFQLDLSFSQIQSEQLLNII
jgi:hypothetical protein